MRSAPIELQEIQYPFLVEEFALRGDSGGAVVDRHGRVETTVFAANESGPPGGLGVPNAVVAEALAGALAPTGTGPCSITIGSHPAMAKAWNRARLFSPSSSAFFSDAISTAEAPSE